MAEGIDTEERSFINGSGGHRQEENVTGDDHQRQEEHVTGNDLQRKEECVTGDDHQRQEKNVTGDDHQRQEEHVTDDDHQRKEEHMTGDDHQRQEEHVTGNYHQRQEEHVTSDDHQIQEEYLTSNDHQRQEEHVTGDDHQRQEEHLTGSDVTGDDHQRHEEHVTSGDHQIQEEHVTSNDHQRQEQHVTGDDHQRQEEDLTGGDVTGDDHQRQKENVTGDDHQRQEEHVTGNDHQRQEENVQGNEHQRQEENVTGDDHQRQDEHVTGDDHQRQREHVTVYDHQRQGEHLTGDDVIGDDHHRQREYVICVICDDHRRREEESACACHQIGKGRAACIDHERQKEQAIGVDQETEEKRMACADHQRQEVWAADAVHQRQTAVEEKYISIDLKELDDDNMLGINGQHELEKNNSEDVLRNKETVNLSASLSAAGKLGYLSVDYLFPKKAGPVCDVVIELFRLLINELYAAPVSLNSKQAAFKQGQQSQITGSVSPLLQIPHSKGHRAFLKQLQKLLKIYYRPTGMQDQEYFNYLTLSKTDTEVRYKAACDMEDEGGTESVKPKADGRSFTLISSGNLNLPILQYIREGFSNDSLDKRSPASFFDAKHSIYPKMDHPDSEQKKLSNLIGQKDLEDGFHSPTDVLNKSLGSDRIVSEKYSDIKSALSQHEHGSDVKVVVKEWASAELRKKYDLMKSLGELPRFGSNMKYGDLADRISLAKLSAALLTLPRALEKEWGRSRTRRMSVPQETEVFENTRYASEGLLTVGMSQHGKTTSSVLLTSASTEHCGDVENEHIYPVCDETRDRGASEWLSCTYTPSTDIETDGPGREVQISCEDVSSPIGASPSHDLYHDLSLDPSLDRSLDSCMDPSLDDGQLLSSPFTLASPVPVTSPPSSAQIFFPEHWVLPQPPNSSEMCSVLNVTTHPSNPLSTDSVSDLASARTEHMGSLLAHPEEELGSLLPEEDYMVIGAASYHFSVGVVPSQTAVTSDMLNDCSSAQAQATMYVCSQTWHTPPDHHSVRSQLPPTTIHSGATRHSEISLSQATNGPLALLPTNRPTYSDDWPMDDTSMALAGFYRQGSRGRLRCYYCDLELDNFQPSHDIWEEHVRYRPTCVYLAAILGRERLLQMQARLERRQREQEISAHATRPWLLEQISEMPPEGDDPIVPPEGDDSTVLPESYDPTVPPEGDDSTALPESYNPTVPPEGDDPTVPP